MFEIVFSQYLAINNISEFATNQSVIDETNISQQIKDFFTSDSAVESYYISSIVLSIILIVGPIIGFMFHLFLWHGVGLLICVFYQIKQRLKWGYAKIDIEELRGLVFHWWSFLGRLIYNYEVVGVENVPTDCPVMLIGFHGTLPSDYINMYAIWSTIFEGRPLPFSVAEKHHTNSATIKLIIQVLNSGSYSRDELVEFLLNGQWVYVFPGGSHEVYHGDEMYRLHWKNRKGFAKVAVEAKAAIVPFFTKNIQEAFRLPWYMEIVWSKKFVFSHLFSSLFSGLPVKLTTFCGPAILYDENLNYEQLADKVHTQLQQLIDENQTLPGNQFRAVLERFWGKTYKINKKLHSQMYKVDGSGNRELTQPLIETV